MRRLSTRREGTRAAVEKGLGHEAKAGGPEEEWPPQGASCSPGETPQTRENHGGLRGQLCADVPGLGQKGHT